MRGRIELPSTDRQSAIIAIIWTHLKTSLLRTLGSNQSNHWLTVKSLHLAWILRSKEVSFFARDTRRSPAPKYSELLPSTTLAANNVFHTPTRPTYSRIVTFVKPTHSRMGRFLSTHTTKHCLSIQEVPIAPIVTYNRWVTMHQNKITICLGVPYGLRSRLVTLKGWWPHQKSNGTYTTGSAFFINSEILNCGKDPKIGQGSKNRTCATRVQDSATTIIIYPDCFGG